MNTLFKTSLLAAFAVLVFAGGLPAKVVGSGKVTTETRGVSGFHGIELLTNGTVMVTQGDAEGLVIEGEDNIIPLVETTVTAKGALRIAFKEHEEIRSTKPLVFKVSAKTLDAVEIAGSGDLRSQALKAEHFAVKVRGSGDVGVDHLETGALAVVIDGSGSVKLAGKAASQTVAVNGSGDYEATGLKTATATVEATGSGDCDIAVSDTLVANVSGSGDVSYYGKPAVTKNTSGSGTVESLGAGK